MYRVLFGVVLTLVFFATGSIAFAAKESLKITPDDLRIKDAPSEEGIYLYVRKKPDIQSVLLTESAELDDNAVATYAFRTYSYHSENAQEKRILDGKFIRTKVNEGYYIIDSTPKTDFVFEQAFVLFLPYKMHFGYDATRKGFVNLEEGGVYISVRTFDKPYADYAGSYRDNSFYIQKQVFVVTTSQVSEDNPEYDAKTVESFKDIAINNKTLPTFVNNDIPLIDAIKDILIRVPRNSSLDIVIALDTTRSMKDDIDDIRAKLIPMLQDVVKDITQFRIGFVEYKDVNEIYLTRKHEFSNDFQNVKNIIQSIKLGGGKDFPEEVYAALHVATNSFEWRADHRMILLIGDAPAHDPPKSSVEKEAVFARAEELGIKIYPFIIPKKKS